MLNKKIKNKSQIQYDSFYFVTQNFARSVQYSLQWTFVKHQKKYISTDIKPNEQLKLEWLKSEFNATLISHFNISSDAFSGFSLK